MATIQNGVLTEVTNDDINQDGRYIIPDGVTSIGNEAFYKCENLRSITLPDGMTSIDRSAFLKCNNLNYIVTGSENIDQLKNRLSGALVYKVTTKKIAD